MQSKSCELTVLGQHYWNLVSREPDMKQVVSLREALERLQSDWLVEQLAAAEHERWSHWQSFLHEQCVEQPDGSLMIPPHLVDRWSSQLSTSYENLSEEEKESDREQVRRYLPIILSAVQTLQHNTRNP